MKQILKWWILKLKNRKFTFKYPYQPLLKLRLKMTGRIPGSGKIHFTEK